MLAEWGRAARVLSAIRCPGLPDTIADNVTCGFSDEDLVLRQLTGEEPERPFGDLRVVRGQRHERSEAGRAELRHLQRDVVERAEPVVAGAGELLDPQLGERVGLVERVR